MYTDKNIAALHVTSAQIHNDRTRAWLGPMWDRLIIAVVLYHIRFPFVSPDVWFTRSSISEKSRYSRNLNN